jgi:O-acetyl-ADP-ribose deacetylase (regulator of RNase III)
MVHYVKGDLLTSDCQYICHQVNCQKKMGSGIAKQIREKWLAAYEIYMTEAKPEILGQIRFAFLRGNIPIQCVVHMFAQEYYGYDGRRYTSYDAFWTCLGEIHARVPKGKTIAFPQYIGCVRGGAKWNIIYTMICEALDEDYNIEFWDYDGG